MQLKSFHIVEIESIIVLSKIKAQYTETGLLSSVTRVSSVEKQLHPTKLWSASDLPLTILEPVSRSHDLTTDFLRFLEKSNSKKLWTCRVRFQ